MTFKNKKNLYHTRTRIKRKNSSRCLSGGGGRDPLVYCIYSCMLSKTIIVKDDIIQHTSANIHMSRIVNAVKVFQDFIDIQEARSNLEVIYYHDEAIPAISFVLSIFKYSEDNPFRYGKICIVKFLNDNNYVFTLSKDRNNLESFRDDLKARYKKDFAIIAHEAANNNSHLQFTISL